MKIQSTILLIILFAFSFDLNAREFTLYPPGDPNYTISIQSLISGVSFGGDNSDIDTLILKDGVYTENIMIFSGDYNIHIKSENGYEYVSIVALNSSLHVFDIAASNVTIEGLTIYGATGTARMGIYIHGGNSHTIKNNRIGYDATHKNYRGVHIHDNVYNCNIIDNIVNYNTDTGIYTQNAHNLYISGNTVNNNSSSASSYKAGIYCLNTYSSTIYNNTANTNNRYGLFLIGSSSIYNTINSNTFSGNGYSGFWGSNMGSDNIICQNSFSSNSSYDIAFSGTSIGSYVFLNDLTRSIAQFQTSSNTMYSPISFYYGFGSNYYKNNLGNYYGGNYTDADNDGVVDGSGTYNIASSCVDFALEVLSLYNDGNMYYADFGRSPENLALGASSNLILKSDISPGSAITYSGNNPWTGQIIFSSAPSSGHTFLVELGTTSDGSSITLGGPDATITGDGSSSIFHFTTDNSEFTLNSGDYLAIRITNNSAASYNLLTGGAFCIISSPEESGALPVELTSFTVTLNNGKLVLNWRTETEVNNYGFEIESKNIEKEKSHWINLGFIEGAGNSNSPKLYSFSSEIQPYRTAYRLKQIDIDGSFNYSEEIEFDGSLLIDFALNQNYPNPFNPSTTIEFIVAKSEFVRLDVHDLLGNKVETLVNRKVAAGKHQIKFDASKLSSGIYIYKIFAGDNVESKKMIFLK